jgi:hypothetical protein
MAVAKRAVAQVNLCEQQEAADASLRPDGDEGAVVMLKQARQKLADAEQKNQRASAALNETLAATKAMIDEVNKRAQDTDAAALLTKLLTEEEVKKVCQDAADYTKRLLADVDAVRDEMNARFAKAIAADENAN